MTAVIELSGEKSARVFLRKGSQVSFVSSVLVNAITPNIVCQMARLYTLGSRVKKIEADRCDLWLPTMDRKVLVISVLELSSLKFGLNSYS